MKYKRIILVLLIFILVFCSSCGSVPEGAETSDYPTGSPRIDVEHVPEKLLNRILSSRWAAEISQEQKALRIFADFIDKFNNRDTDGIVALFSEYARRETVLEDRIADLYAYVETTIESYDMDEKLATPASRSSSNGKKKGGVKICTEVATKQSIFHIEVDIELRDDFDTNNEGIQYIYIAKKEDYEEALSVANEDCYGEEYDLIHGWVKWPTGIFINKLPISAQS